MENTKLVMAMICLTFYLTGRVISLLISHLDPENHNLVTLVFIAIKLHFETLLISICFAIISKITAQAVLML